MSHDVRAHGHIAHVTRQARPPEAESSVPEASPAAEAPAATAEPESSTPLGAANEFHSEDFASGSPDDFESDAWRKEMQAELGIDGDQEMDFENDEWEMDLANELEDLQKEIDC